jgi:hypothetical protein
MGKDRIDNIESMKWTLVSKTIQTSHCIAMKNSVNRLFRGEWMSRLRNDVRWRVDKDWHGPIGVWESHPSAVAMALTLYASDTCRLLNTSLMFQREHVFEHCSENAASSESSSFRTLLSNAVDWKDRSTQVMRNDARIRLWLGASHSLLRSAPTPWTSDKANKQQSVTSIHAWTIQIEMYRHHINVRGSTPLRARRTHCFD